jgi:hypothetical protein
MRKLHYLLLAIVLSLFGECKKVTKKVNSEKMFSLVFADSLNKPINQCYDRVWSDGKGNLTNCSNTTIGFQLPLSIKSDSNIFYFKKNDKTDTLILVYHKLIVPGTNEFEVLYDLTRLKSSFEKSSLKCIPDLTPKCNGDKASLSAVIFQ